MKNSRFYLCRWTDTLEYFGIFGCDNVDSIFHTIQIFYIDNGYFCGIILGSILQFPFEINSNLVEKV